MMDARLVTGNGFRPTASSAPITTFPQRDFCLVASDSYLRRQHPGIAKYRSDPGAILEFDRLMFRNASLMRDDASSHISWCTGDRAPRLPAMARIGSTAQFEVF